MYIKARGLSDLIIEKLSNINSETLKTDDLLKILKLLRMQPIQSTPLHLEFLIQYEGKTILSYFLNQTSFYNLTDGDSKLKFHVIYTPNICCVYFQL